MKILIIDDTSKTMDAIEANIENYLDFIYVESGTLAGARVILQDMDLDMVVLNMTVTSMDAISLLLELSTKYRHLKVFSWSPAFEQKKGCDHFKKLLSKI